jgi:arylsulfatase A-like enzyme
MSRQHRLGAAALFGLTLAIALASTAGCGGDGAAQPAPVRRNVLLIVVDTLRADHLGLYGYSRPTSPELDAWARGGVVFTQARSQAACTFPSVNSILTSRYPVDFLGQEGARMGIPEHIPSLAETLRAAGYRTLAVSASPIVRRSPSHFNPEGGFDRGFDVFDESCLWKAAGCVRRAARKLLRESPRPFFLYLHFMDPHGPYNPPPAHQRVWSAEKTGLDYIDGGDPRPIAEAITAGGLPEGLEPRHVQHLVDLYDDEILYLDGQLAALFGMLSALQDETLMVLAADHGEEFLEHGEVKHCKSVFDTGVRTPLVLRIPGVAGGRRIAAPAQNLDIVPTLLDYLGIPAGDLGHAGRSLRPLLETGVPVHRHVVSTERTLRAVTSRRHKLVYDLRERGIQLYDLLRDPAEQRDLAARQPRVTRELMRGLRDWMREHEGDRAERSVQNALEAEKRLRALGYIQ